MIFMPNKHFRFKCNFCGKDFGMNVIELALHIAKVHDQKRSNTDI